MKWWSLYRRFSLHGLELGGSRPWCLEGLKLEACRV